MKTKLQTVAFIVVFIISCVTVSCPLYAQSPDGPGRVSTGSYSGGGIDSVNLYNGNVMADIGVFSHPGREIGTELRLSYNSQGWQTETSLFADYGAYSGGFRAGNPVGVGSVVPDLVLLGCYQSGPEFQGEYKAYVEWTDGTGSTHLYSAPSFLTPWSDLSACTYGLSNFSSMFPLWLSSEIGADDSYALAGTNAVFIYLADGSIVIPNTALETRNGNHADYITGTGMLDDTLGRSITMTSSTSGTNSFRTYIVHDSQGTSRTYQLEYDTAHSVYNPVENISQNIRVLSSIDFPNSTSYTFEYAHAQGFLTKITLPTGGYIAFDYVNGNSSHNLADNYIVGRRVYDGVHSEQTWTYARIDSGGVRTVTVTDPQGHQVVHTFDGAGEETRTEWKENSSASPSKTVTTTWLGGRPSVTVTQIGGVKQQQTFTWSNNRLVESTQSDWYPASGSVINLTKTVNTFGTLWPPSSVRLQETELQQWIGSAYVTQGKTHYDYDEYSLATVSGAVPGHHSPLITPRNNPTTVRRYADASNYVEEHFHYDEVGNVVAHVDVRGKITSFNFTDNFYGVTGTHTFAYPTVVTDALSHTTTTQYYYDTGLPRTVTDARGKTSAFTYDALGRPSTITGPISGSQSAYTYTDSTPKVEVDVTVSTGVVRKSETVMDKFGRAIQMKSFDPDGDVFVDTEYNGIGLMSKVSEPYRSGTPVWTETAYDVLGRPTTITNPDSTTVTFSYSGNVVTQYDALNIPRQYTTNALGQLIKVLEPNPTLSTPIETDYQYYVFGPLQQVVQNGNYGLTRSFTSDWLGRITSEMHPETGTTSYAYNASGLVTTRTDARNIHTNYSYDDIGRLTAVDYDDATPDVVYTYDGAGYSGLLTSVNVNGVTGTSFTYDDAGRVTGESVTRNGLSGSFNTAYTYDLGGRLLATTYPSGRVITQAYAASGGIAGDRISGLTDSPTSATLLQSTAVNAAGLLIARTLGSSITEARSYNARNQLTNIRTPASGTAKLDLSYDYGTTNNGRIQSRTDAVQPEHSTNYTYDAIGRLTAAGNSTWNIAWTLDAYGNRLTQTPTGLASALGSPTVSYSNNKMNGSPYTYDDAGNLTYDGTYHYYYDAENRVCQIGSSAIAYAYDQAGRRIKKTSGGSTTYYFYGLTGLMSEFTTSGSPSNATAATSTDQLQYRVGEQTGTGVLLIASDGTPRENNRVFPFGEPWNTGTSSTNNEKFTTYQHDTESDLDYAMARYYASRAGRFLTSDPGHVGASIEDPQSLNAYVYALNDPINGIDPMGLDCIYVDHLHEDGVVNVERGNKCSNFEGIYVDGAIGDDIYYNRDRRTLSFGFTREDVIGLQLIDMSRRSNDDLDDKGLAFVRAMDARVDASNHFLEAGIGVSTAGGVMGGLAVAAAPAINALAFGPSTGRVMYQFGRITAAGEAGRLIDNSRLGSAYNQFSKMLPDFVARKGWDFFSRFWASGASGDVHIFPEARTDTSALWNVELPILFQNPLIRKIFH